MYACVSWKDLADWRGEMAGRELRKGSGIVTLKGSCQLLQLPIFLFLSVTLLPRH